MLRQMLPLRFWSCVCVSLRLFFMNARGEETGGEARAPSLFAPPLAARLPALLPACRPPLPASETLTTPFLVLLFPTFPAVPAFPSLLFPAPAFPVVFIRE